MDPDFTVTNHGSLWLLTLITEAAQAWAAEHLPSDALRWGDHSIVVEPRYLENIVLGIQGDGLTVHPR